MKPQLIGRGEWRQTEVELAAKENGTTQGTKHWEQAGNRRKERQGDTQAKARIGCSNKQTSKQAKKGAGRPAHTSTAASASIRPRNEMRAFS